jgi:hypothetical protein
MIRLFLVAGIVLACAGPFTQEKAQAQSWGMYNRVGKQTPRNYGEPCWSAALSKCTRRRTE